MKKLRFEPYYKNLDADTALKCGYFSPTHNAIDWKKHVNIPCTPINFLEQSNDSDFPAIIIGTGALCPMHKGHVDMMYRAKDVLLERGYKVIGGYISPGHDEYIKQKTGDNWMPIHRRIQWANDLLNESQDHSWLAIDPWEGVYAPGAVNFTSVVYRLQQYVKKFYRQAKNVKIFFVCGADNARFVVPFENSNIGCVVVGRPGYDEILQSYEHKECDSILFTTGDNSYNSTAIRKTDKYREFNTQKIKQAYLRIHWNHWEKNVLVELKKWFSHVWTEDFEDQVKEFKSNKITDTIINLDTETHHGRKLDVSRLFDLHGQKKLGYTHRPKKLPIRKQIELMLIAKHFNKCYLFDDDIFSGSTMNYIENILKEYGVSVIGRMSFISGSLNDKEVLDAKDFLVAYEDGGLISNMNGKLVRLPYMYPFVCPATRASISDPIQFSINMWELNMEMWKDKEATIQSCENYQFLTKLGHKHTTTIYEMCKYYRDFLREIADYY